MPKVWFTSDTHLGHANIIKYCDRPFRDVDDQDAALIAYWTARVRPDDEVWHIGDFCFKGRRSADSYLARLPGRLHLIWGNHDDDATRAHPRWLTSDPWREIVVEGQRIVLCHYAHRVWPRSHHGSLMLYGHSHNTLTGDSQSTDVGVDVPAFGFAPASLSEIRAHLRTLPPRGCA